ncbi:MAG: hypothetical protein ACRCWI_08480 [Brevinema sp.]
MVLYKILALLLVLSPITIYSDILYFPYSFLGMTLFFLSSLFSYKNYFPFCDFLFWSFSTLTIITQKPISYQLILNIFILYQYLTLYVSNPKLHITIFIGILLSLIGLIFPETTFISIVLLAFIISVDVLITKKNKTNTAHNLSQNLSDEHQNRIIPLEIHEQQEQDHVIPLYTEEQN